MALIICHCLETILQARLMHTLTNTTTAKIKCFRRRKIKIENNTRLVFNKKCKNKKETKAKLVETKNLSVKTTQFRINGLPVPTSFSGQRTDHPTN